MKLTTLIAAVAIAAAILTTHANAGLLEARAKLEGAKSGAESAVAAAPGDADLTRIAADKAQALAAFDAAATARFGQGWLARWQNSKYAKPDDEAVDIYIAGTAHDWKHTNLAGASVPKRVELAAYLATKSPLQTEDINTVLGMDIHNPDVAARIDEFATLLPSKGARDAQYFAFKHLGVMGRPGNGLAWTQHMTTAEWFELAAADAHFEPRVFTAMRDHLLATAAKLLIDKRRAAGQPVEGPEFDAAFAPVLAALKAPKFDGLAASVASLGLDLVVPAADYKAQEAVAAAVAGAAALKATFATSWGEQVSYQHGLGSVMFVMGESAYQVWREDLLKTR
jgi:hypothetical protein